MIRSYSIAMPLPDGTRAYLAELCCGIPSAEWVNPDDLHLTLLALGGARHVQPIDIQPILNEIHFEPLTVTLKSIEVKKKNKFQGKLIVTLRECPELEILFKQLAKELKPFIDHRPPYAPHIPLAQYSRIDESRLADFLASHALLDPHAFIADTLVLEAHHQTEKRHYFEAL